MESFGTAIWFWSKEVRSRMTPLQSHTELNKHIVNFPAVGKFIPSIFIQSRSLIWSF